ncbi:MAG: GHKL domain-containing protein [Oscillospiraceae bacterium]|nr:GHKL domain-containing protein [Oscillospiraceae bacterium]
MIRTLRKRFTVTAMIAVTVLLLAILGAVNAFNAWSNERETEELLDALCETEPGGGRGPRSPGGEKGAGRELWARGPMEDVRMSALFFTVYADSEGEIRSTELSRIASVDEEEAEAIYLAAAGKSEGRVGSFRFRSVTTEDGGSRTVFLDTGLRRAEVLRVALLSLLAGLVGWGLMLLFVTFLSKKAIEPIAQNMEKQKRFVTDAGHELKTPLAIILANTEAMELRQGENKYTKNIRGQVERLSGLTQNLLALARADEGRAPANAADFSLSELAEEAVKPFREPAELRGLTLEAAIAGGVSARGDRAQLAQLLSILLDNAVKYASPGGRIELSLQREGGRAVLRVSNDAEEPKVPPERLFDRFYRADDARTQKGGGCGIGLSAARAIAEAHRGSLNASYENGRICFTLRL